MFRKISLLTIIFLFYSKTIIAQCAMCKAVVEDNLESGGSVGAGLNNGILYLMAIPYVAITFFAIAYYFHFRTQKAN
jgi:hypothetical protein